MLSYAVNCSSETALTLDKAIQIGRADEATNIHEQEFAKDGSANPYANRIQTERSTTGSTRTSCTHTGKHGKFDKPVVPVRQVRKI